MVLAVELASLVSRMVGSSWPRSVMKNWRKVRSRTGLVFVDARGAMLAAGDIKGDDAPSRWRQVVDLGEQAWRASPQGDEGYSGRIEPIEAVVGSELGVEDEVLRQAAVLTLPEGDETKDLLGLVALADVGVRITEYLAVGVLDQEGEDAGLAAAAL